MASTVAQVHPGLIRNGELATAGPLFAANAVTKTTQSGQGGCPDASQSIVGTGGRTHVFRGGEAVEKTAMQFATAKLEAATRPKCSG